MHPPSEGKTNKEEKRPTWDGDGGRTNPEAKQRRTEEWGRTSVNQPSKRSKRAGRGRPIKSQSRRSQKGRQSSPVIYADQKTPEGTAMVASYARYDGKCRQLCTQIRRFQKGRQWSPVNVGYSGERNQVRGLPSILVWGVTLPVLLLGPQEEQLPYLTRTPSSEDN